nr:hypothetical protein [Anaerolineae bacterium]
KRMLLIFDNFEHVLGGVPVINDLMRAAPGVKVVATSRERLNLMGETLYPLDGLDLPADISTEAIGKSSAAQLFLQSARRARPGFELTDDDLPLVAEVCRTVGGLPLGIVLAAAWVQTLSLKEVLEELRTGLDFLETEMGDVPQRHRSIRSVFDYSWKLMRPEERDLVATLSVFRGGLSRRAGQEVAGAGLRALATLVNKSLLRRDPDVGSYHMHELLRQYAYSQLDSSGRAEMVRQAHSAYYLGVLAELRPALQGGDQIGTLYKLADDIENVRAAWDWALDRASYPLIAGALPTLSIYFELCGRFFEGEAFFEQAAAKLRAQPASPVRDRLLGELLARSCTLAITLHHREAADALLAEADALLGESASTPARAALAFAHGFCHLTLKKAVDARPYLERAAELYRTHEDWWALARTLDELSSTYWYRADGQTTDLDKAKELLTEALGIQKLLGDVYGLATTTLHLGTVASYALDDAEDARLTAEALVLFQQINHRHNVAHTLNNMGVRELMNGQYSAARPYLEQSLHIRHEIGSVTSIAWGIFALSRLDYSEGDFVSVVKRTGEGLALVAGSVHVEWELTLLFSRAQARWALGEYPFALADYGRTDQLARQLDNQEDVLYTLNRRGAVALAMRDDANAAAWLSRAKAEAEEKDDQTTALLSQALLARLALLQGKPADAREQVSAPVDYFTNEEAWQMSYSTDQWQMSAYAVEALVTLADARRVLGERAAALTALGRAFRTAQAIVSPAHLLSVAAAYAEVVAVKEPLLAARLSARVATHSAAYAVDKVRARAVLHRAASSKVVPPEAFAEACLTGEGMAFPMLIDALADDLLAG